jgi:hypothetical protein
LLGDNPSECGECCGVPGYEQAGDAGRALYRFDHLYSSDREYEIMNPLMILELIALTEKLAVVIDAQVQASNSAQELTAWNAAQAFYLQGLATLKAKVAAEEAAASAPVVSTVVGG